MSELQLVLFLQLRDIWQAHTTNSASQITPSNAPVYINPSTTSTPFTPPPPLHPHTHPPPPTHTHKPFRHPRPLHCTSNPISYRYVESTAAAAAAATAAATATADSCVAAWGRTTHLGRHYQRHVHGPRDRIGATGQTERARAAWRCGFHLGRGRWCEGPGGRRVTKSLWDLAPVRDMNFTNRTSVSDLRVHLWERKRNNWKQPVDRIL